MIAGRQRSGRRTFRVRPADGLEHQPEDAPSSRGLWESPGFSYSGLDFDRHHDSIAIDLNRDIVPRRLRDIVPRRLKGAF